MMLSRLAASRGAVWGLAFSGLDLADRDHKMHKTEFVQSYPRQRVPRPIAKFFACSAMEAAE
jgi:hypothetical protein